MATNETHIQAYLKLIDDIKAAGIESEHLQAAADGVLKKMMVCELKEINKRLIAIYMNTKTHTLNLEKNLNFKEEQ